MHRICNPLFIAAKATVTDFYCLSLVEAIILTVFCTWVVVFSFIDFNYFVDPANHPYVYITQNDELWGIEPWRRSLMKLSGAAAFSGALSVVFTNKGRISSFTWGLVNVVTYGAMAASYGYSGDTLLNLIVYLPAQFVGIYAWAADAEKAVNAVTLLGQKVDTDASVKEVNDEERQLAAGDAASTSTSSAVTADAGLAEADGAVTSFALSWPMRLIALSAAGGVAVAFYYATPPFAIALIGMYFFEGMELPRTLDSCICGLSVIAQILLIFQYYEQWVLWIVVDILAIIQWSGANQLPLNINAVSMYCLYLVNALIGFYVWLQRNQKQQQQQQQEQSRKSDTTASPSSSNNDKVGVVSASSSLSPSEVQLISRGGDEETGLGGNESSTSS